MDGIWKTVLLLAIPGAKLDNVVTIRDQKVIVMARKRKEKLLNPVSKKRHSYGLRFFIKGDNIRTTITLRHYRNQSIAKITVALLKSSHSPPNNFVSLHEKLFGGL